MPTLIRPPDNTDVTSYMRLLFLRAERDIINEIKRKRASGYVDYAEVAALERIQKILQELVDESWNYVPKMIEKIFYHSEKDAAGYTNARSITGGSLSAAQLSIAEQLSNNLLGEIGEAAAGAYESAQKVFTIARLEDDRKWSMQDYGNMAVRTTARQAQVAALLTADDYDLWQIVKIGSTCPVCAPLEGRVYSKSGTNPDYPPLTVAFGKIDPAGSNDLTNTYLNIHPNCLHALVRYTTIGKSAERIQKDKDFSSIEKNPLSRDPRTKKQVEAYREKQRKRQQLYRDMKQHKEYRAVLGKDIPKDFAKFRDLKYNDPEKWEYAKGLKEYLEKYPSSNKKYYNVGCDLKKLGMHNIGDPLPPQKKQAFILPEGKRDPYHIMHRMMERQITDDDIRGYMNNAHCMFSQWGGKRQVFYSSSGVCVITKNGDDWIYKTAWNKTDFDESTDTILEVIRKNGL